MKDDPIVIIKLSALVAFKGVVAEGRGDGMAGIPGRSFLPVGDEKEGFMVPSAIMALAFKQNCDPSFLKQRLNELGRCY